MNHPIKYAKDWFKIYLPNFSLAILKLKKSKLPLENLSDTPWISNKAIEWLDSNIDNNKIIFEYGGGGSTVYFSKKAKKVFSVEHKIDWYLKIISRLKKEELKNCKIYCAQPQTSNKNTDEIYGSTDKRYGGMNFKKYAETIRKFPDNYFDLVFVDGRARNGCIKNAIPKIKEGGYLVLDNSNRPEYATGKKFLEKFERSLFFDQVSGLNSEEETTVWHITKKSA